MALDVNQLLKLREIQNNPNKQEISEVIVDGNVIKGYFTYTFFTQKTYPIEPVRSQGGVIDNLDSYATFLTPTLKIKFNALSIDLYRKVMLLIESRNEFVVTAYDVVRDKFVTHKMYFSPQDYPELYIYNLEVLGVLNYEIELIGTNSDLDTVSIVYHTNKPDGSDSTQGTASVPKGTESIIEMKSVSGISISGYRFKNWNTKPDGTGFTYVDGYAYTINESLELYAQWEESDAYTLSYNYGYGEQGVDGEGNDLNSKDVRYNHPIGTLPTTKAQKVTYNNEEYEPYVFDGWYKTPKKAENSVALTENSLYDVKGNSTIYQLFDVLNYSITFNSVGGNYTPKTMTQEYNSSVYEPNEPTKENKTFDGWWTTSDYQSGTKFTFTTMPPKNITLYAKWA